MNKAINFTKNISKIILFPVTKWHLYGMLAYLIERLGEEEFLSQSIIVYAIKHSEGGYLISESDMPYENLLLYEEDDLMVSNKCLFKMPLLLGNFVVKKHTILALTANSLLLRKTLTSLSIKEIINNNIEVIAVDDGIGSYLSNRVWEKCSEAEGKAVCRDKIKKKLSKILQNFFSFQEWHMLSNVNGQLKKMHVNGYATVIRHDISNSFSEQLDEFRQKYSNKKKVLLITQPWSETQQMDQREEIEIIENVVMKLKSRGYTIFIKKHPREIEHKYNFNNVMILGGKYPAEFYFCLLSKEDLVIGFNSTALVNSALLFNLNTMTLANKVMDRNRDNMMEIANREFLNLTSDFIKIYSEQWNMLRGENDFVRE